MPDCAYMRSVVYSTAAAAMLTLMTIERLSDKNYNKKDMPKTSAGTIGVHPLRLTD